MFSCRTSIGKQVVFLWVLIPNQQRFTFRWVFQEAIPTLLPKWLCDRAVFITKDADPQQRDEILASFKTVFKIASEGTCRFHEVHMGWKKHVSSFNAVCIQKIKKWILVLRKIHKWIYSWMMPGCIEDKDEYNLSKYLLEQFICSAAVLDAIDGHQFIIARIVKFLRYHVYPWETLYLHFYRKTLGHFDTSNSSTHGGANHGMKSHSAGVQATKDAKLSAKTMNTQTNMELLNVKNLFIMPPHGFIYCHGG
jgi:hypothetical protein